MKFIKINLKQKVLIVSGMLIAMFLINTIVSLLTVDQAKREINNSVEVLNPSLNLLNKFILVTTQSKMYVTSWINFPNDKVEKEKLKELHSFIFPELREKIGLQKKEWVNQQNAAKMDTIILRFTELLDVQRKIMDRLSRPEDYHQTVKIDEANRKLETVIAPQIYNIIDKLEALEKEMRDEQLHAQNAISNSFFTMKWLTVFLGLLLVLFTFFISLLVFKNISNPILYIHDIIEELSVGKIPRDYERVFGDDEVGEMARALAKLVNGFKKTADFAENIGKGNYVSAFEPLSGEDVLGNSLISMRNNLAEVAKESEQRDWVNEGIAKFSDTLRLHRDNIEDFSTEVIVFVVNYVKANQGAIFLVEEYTTDNGMEFMKMKAAYAWDRVKFFDKKIYKGEGLAGQAWLEEETVFITDIPKGYIEINSGLGNASPKCVMIVPLIANERIYGVMELASFDIIKDFEVDFINKICRNFASTISTVKINERTHSLLANSTQMTEQLRAHEEEMRQNVEELEATQEEMRKYQRDVKQKDRLLNATNLVVETDLSFTIKKINNHAFDYLRYEPYELLEKPVSRLFKIHLEYKAMKDALNDSDLYSGIVTMAKKDKTNILAKIAVGTYKDKNKEVQKYIFIIDNISEVKDVLEQYQAL